MNFHNPNILASGILVCTGYWDGQLRLCVNLTIPSFTLFPVCLSDRLLANCNPPYSCGILAIAADDCPDYAAEVNIIPDLTMDTPTDMVCSSCRASVPPPANFCPNCGKPLRTIPPATSVSMQIIVYLISFFIAPFGLWYAWKYLKQDDEKSKIIGVVTIALTIAAVAVAIWTTAELFNSVRQFWNSLSGLGL
jgi:hypothetical protein